MREGNRRRGIPQVPDTDRGEAIREVSPNDDNRSDVFDPIRTSSRLAEVEGRNRLERTQALDKHYDKLIQWFHKKDRFNFIENEQQKYEYITRLAIAIHTARTWKVTTLKDYGWKVTTLNFPRRGHALRQKSEEMYEESVKDIEEIGLELAANAKLQKQALATTPDRVGGQQTMDQQERGEEIRDIKALERQFENTERFISRHLSDVPWNRRGHLIIDFLERRDSLDTNIRHIARTYTQGKDHINAIKITAINKQLDAFQNLAVNLVMQKKSYNDIIEQANRPLATERISGNALIRLEKLEKQIFETYSYITAYITKNTARNRASIPEETLGVCHRIQEKISTYCKEIYKMNTPVADRERYLSLAKLGFSWISELKDNLEKKKKKVIYAIQKRPALFLTFSIYLPPAPVCRHRKFQLLKNG